MDDADCDAGLLSNLNSPPFADICMRDASESSTEGESEDDGERMADCVDEACVSKKTFGISGSPPKLINTPPSTLAQTHQQPSTIRREIRRSESWQGAQRETADELEDGRHIGGLTCPKGELTRKQLSANEIPPLRTPALGRSRSLPDFTEVQLLGNHKGVSECIMHIKPTHSEDVFFVTHQLLLVFSQMWICHQVPRDW